MVCDLLLLPIRPALVLNTIGRRAVVVCINGSQAVDPRTTEIEKAVPG